MKGGTVQVRGALLLGLGMVSALHGVAYGLGLPGRSETVGLVLGLVMLPLVLHAWRSRSAWLWSVLALFGTAQAVVFARFLMEVPLPFPHRPLLLVILALYLALVILLVGSPLPKPDAGAVILLSVSIAGGALLLEAVGSKILERRSGSLSQDLDDPEYVVSYRGQQEEDPEIGPVPIPNSETEKLFPDNPRGYFKTRDASWQLSNQPSSNSRLEETGTGVSVLIDRAEDPTTWHIQLSHLGLDLAGHTEYRLRFRVRATREREYSFAVTMAHPPWETLGLYETATADTEWTWVERTLTTPQADDNARVNFDLGGDTANVDIADLSLVPTSGGPAVGSRLGSEYYVSYEWNSHGCRAPEYLIPPAPNAFRIIALGDSFAQGSGVHFEDVFTSVMERRLREEASRAHDPRLFEVFGCAVAGFSTREERLYYEKRVRAYQPDVVLVAMVWNDSRSFSNDVALGYVHTPAKWEFLVHTAYLVQEIRHTLPEPDFSDSMQELTVLNQQLREEGAKLGVVVFRNAGGEEWERLSEQADSAGKALGVPVLDLGDALLTGDYQKDLMVHPIDGHPNEIAHRIAAERILDWLEEEGLMEPPGSAGSG